MKPSASVRITQALAALFGLAGIFLLCFFCWQYMAAFYNQASEQVKHSYGSVEARLISGN